MAQLLGGAGEEGPSCGTGAVSRSEELDGTPSVVPALPSACATDLSVWAEVKTYLSAALQEELRWIGQRLRDDAREEWQSFLEEYRSARSGEQSRPPPLQPAQTRLAPIRVSGVEGSATLLQDLDVPNQRRSAVTPDCSARLDSKSSNASALLLASPWRSGSVAQVAQAPEDRRGEPTTAWGSDSRAAAPHALRECGLDGGCDEPLAPSAQGSHSSVRKGSHYTRHRHSGRDSQLGQQEGVYARRLSTDPMGKVQGTIKRSQTSLSRLEEQATMTAFTRVKTEVSKVVTELKISHRFPVFEPQGLFMSCWRPFMLLLTLFAVSSAPFDIAFWWEPPTLYKFVGYLVDVIFITDVLLQFRIAYVHGECLERNPVLIAKHYARTWLLLDIVSNTPMDWFVGSAGKHRKLLKLVKIPKLIRLLRLVRLLKDQSHYIGVTTIVGLIALVSHYYACFWALSLLGSVCEEEASACPRVAEAYLECLSVSVSSLSGSDAWTRFFGPDGTTLVGSLRGPGKPLEPYEELTASLMTMIGFLLIACLFSNVSSVMASANAAGRTIMQKRLRLKKEMTLAHVPKMLQLKVKGAYEHLWQFGHTEHSMLHDPVLSLDLRRRLALCAYGPHLYKVPMFSHLPESDMMRIAQKVQQRFFTPGDLIYAKGEKGDDMHFMESGEAVAIGDQKEVLKYYYAGDFFGEICFLNPGLRSVSVRCEEFSATLVLRAKCFHELAMDDVLVAIREEAQMAEIEYLRLFQRSSAAASAVSSSESLPTVTTNAKRESGVGKGLEGLR